VRLARVRRAFCYKDFVERFIEKASQLKMGRSLDQKTDQGAIASKTQLEKDQVLRRFGSERGRESVLGGKAPESITNVARWVFLSADCNHRSAGFMPDKNREEILGRSSRSRHSTTKKK